VRWQAKLKKQHYRKLYKDLRASEKFPSGNCTFQLDIDKVLLTMGGSKWGCFLLSIDILATILHRKAGYGDAIGGGRWLGGRSF
jgi:hypothetical protein